MSWSSGNKKSVKIDNECIVKVINVAYVTKTTDPQQKVQRYVRTMACSSNRGVRCFNC